MAQYQSQFVPTDFNTLGNVIGMYRQDLNQMDQEFDAAASAEAQTLAEIGALSSYDEAGKAQRLEAVSKSMEEAVARRGGDYRLAAKDLQRIVARERANPWYQWNAQNQKTMEDYRKLAMNADNLIIGTPARTYAEAQQMQANGQDPHALSALSKTGLYKQVSDIASNLKARMESDPKFKNTLGGQYFRMMLDSKVTPENFEAFINTGEGAEIMRSVIASNPQLEGTNLSTVKEVIKQGLYSAIGKNDSQLVANQNHINPYEAYRMRDEKDNKSGYYPDVVEQSGYGLFPTSLNDLDSRVFKPRADKLAQEKAKELGIKGVNSFDDLRNQAITERPIINPEALAKMTDKQQQDWVKRTTESPQSKLAKQALTDIEKIIQAGGEGLALPTYNFNTLVAPSGKSITEVSNLEEGFVKEINKNKSRFTGITKEDKNNFDKITKDMQITDISNDFQKDKAGLYLYVSGFDKDGEPVNARVELNPSELMLEQRLMSFVRPLSKKLDNEYRYAKNPQGVLKEAQEDLAEAERIGDEEVASTIRKFIELKTSK